MINAKSFTYNGKKSDEDFGLKVVMNESDFTKSLGLAREVVKGETTKFRNTPNYLGTKYSDVLSFQIFVMKDICKVSQKDMKWSREDVRKVTAWLSSSKIPRMLFFEYANDKEENYDYYGLFTDMTTYTFGHEVYGLTLQFTCANPYAYTKEQNYICNGDSKIIIDNTSDEWEDYVYPQIEIVPDTTETITIANETENKSLTVKILKGNNIYIDCANNIVTDVSGIVTLDSLGISIQDLDKLYWFRLLNGENRISVKGRSSVIFKCRYPRKVGEI